MQFRDRWMTRQIVATAFISNTHFYLISTTAFQVVSSTMECEEFFVPVRSFAVERLCGPSSEKDKDAAVFPAELKSQLTLKAVTADPFWKFDVSFAKRVNIYINSRVVTSCA